MLQQLGAIMRNGIGARDLMGCFGDEEFVILLRRAHLDDARQFAERLRLTIARTAFPPLSGGQAVTASFGVAERRSGEEVWELSVRADVALYEVESAGGGRVVADVVATQSKGIAVTRPWALA